MPTTLEPKTKEQIEEETFVRLFGHNLARQNQDETESSPEKK